MTVRALLFDFNGVLLDDEAVHFELFRKVLRSEGLDLTREQYDEVLVALDDERGFQAAFAAAGQSLDEARCRRLIEEKSREYDAWMAQRGYPFFPGAADVVRAAHRAGLRLGIVSGALRGEIEGALAQEGLRSLFDFVVAAEDVTESKPHPAGYLAGLRSMKTLATAGEALEASTVAAIEDTNEGIAAARAAGLKTVGIAHTFDAAHLEADWVLPNIGAFDVEALGRRFGVRTAGAAG